MVAPFRTRRRFLLLEPEGTYGTEETPTVAANALAVEDLRYTMDFQAGETNEHKAALDGSAPIPQGGSGGFTANRNVRGAGTQGNAPADDAMWRMAGLGKTTLGTALDDTAQAGAASTITLASGESSTDDAYKGMPITLDGGTGSGQTRVITAYDGTTKVATVSPAWDTQPDGTSEYTVPKCVVYSPVSYDLEAATAWIVDPNNVSANNSIQRRFRGNQANLVLSVNARQHLRAAMTVRGELVQAPADVSDMGALTDQDSVRPYPLIGADSYLGDAAIKFADLSVDLGNVIEMADDPTATYGYDVAEIMTRRITGTVRARTELVATRNAFADFLAGTQRAFWLNWGSGAGNNLSILMPTIQLTSPPDADDERGFAYDPLAFQAVGDDAGLYLCFY